MAKEGMKQEELDKLADIIWWIRGYKAGADATMEPCPFDEGHIYALGRAKKLLEGPKCKFCNDTGIVTPDIGDISADDCPHCKGKRS